ncbi:tetraspanin-8-like [Alosa pseudoharengus]
MAPPNTCLKRAFSTLDVVLTILGAFILAFALFQHGVLHNEQKVEEFHVVVISVYAIGAAIAAGATLGLYGVRKEKQWALIVSSVGMTIISLFLLLISIATAIEANKVEQYIEESYKLDHLHEVSEDRQQDVEEWQTMLQCCGLQNGFQDWHGHHPESCLCPEKPDRSIKCVTALFINGTTTVEELVYEQTCLPLMVGFMRRAFNIFLTLLFGLSILVVIATVMTLALLYQMRKKTVNTAVVFKLTPSGSTYAQFSNSDQHYLLS